MSNKSAYRAERVKAYQYYNIPFDFFGITEQHGKTHARVGDKPREQRSERNSALNKSSCYYYGRGAVGYKTYRRGYETFPPAAADNGYAQQAVFAEQKPEYERNDEYKQKGLRGVPERNEQITLGKSLF